MAVYCAQADIEGRLGADAVALREAANPGCVTSAINRASRRIDFFLLPRYGVNLTGSAWVTEAAADLAAVYLCQSKGNPAPEAVLLAYEELVGKDGLSGMLGLIRKTLANVPDVSALGSAAPRLTNYHMRNVPVPHVVAEPTRSTDPAHPVAPRQDWTDPLRISPENW